MQTPPTDPPMHSPIRDLRTANHADGYYMELISRESAEFMANAPIKRGTKYSDILGARDDVIALFPSGLWFCSEIVPLRSSQVGGMPGERFVIWVWSSDRFAQSSTNAEITYAEESVAHPIFARDSIIRRDLYQTNPTAAAASALTALIGVTITAGGAGYTYATGTIATGATVAFVCSGGAIISGIVTNEGSAVASGGAITITGNGAGATATAVIQPAGAVLIHQEKRELAADDPLAHEFVRIIRVYKTEPGPILTTQSRSADARGVLIDTTKQEGLNGTLDPETGNGIISSTTSDLDSVLEERTTKRFHSNTLPNDESWAYWDFVPLPLLLFSITNTIYCNGTQNLKVVSNPVTTGGASVLRKHRTTVGYSNTYPNPDLSGSTYTTRDVRYQGVFIGFSYSNVLNDSLSYSESASYTGVCSWTEAYTFSASTPSATTFAAGAWYVREFKVEPYGVSGFRWVKTEFYSAPGNPSI